MSSWQVLGVRELKPPFRTYLPDLPIVGIWPAKPEGVGSRIPEPLFWCPLSLPTPALLPQWCPNSFPSFHSPSLSSPSQTPWDPPPPSFPAYSLVGLHYSCLFWSHRSETCNQPSKRLQQAKPSFTEGVSTEHGPVLKQNSECRRRTQGQLSDPQPLMYEMGQKQKYFIGL